MQPPRNHETVHAIDTATTTNSAQVAELAVLIDAIPPEYREDVLLAALWLGTNKTFQDSYMVGSLRNQLCDCLMEKTGTLHDFKTIRQLDRSVIERQLRPFTATEGMETIVIVIESLLNCLADAL